MNTTTEIPLYGISAIYVDKYGEFHPEVNGGGGGVLPLPVDRSRLIDYLSTNANYSFALTVSGSKGLKWLVSVQRRIEK